MAGEWWGDLCYEVTGDRFVDWEGREHPFTVFEGFATIGIVPAPTVAKRAPLQRLELCFSDDRLRHHFWVEQQAINKDWELFLLLRGGSKITLVSNRPFVRRTSGKRTAYTLRLSEGQWAGKGFLELLVAHLRKLIQTHFET